MIRREHGEGLCLLTQTAHSWLSGQLGQRWGNARFAVPAPRAEVLVAIEQHDNGWAEWEQAPRLLRDGRPMGFMEMALADHLDIWRRGAARLTTQSRYAALLVSLHGALLLRMRLDRPGDSPEEKATLRAFLAEEEARQEGLRAALARVPFYGPHLEEAALRANLRLLQACDALSLMLCVPWPQERRLEVPGAAGAADLTTVVARVEGTTLLLTPWPFAEQGFSICAEGQCLEQASFPDESTFHAALAATPLARLEFAVRPG